jgi:hypothetical protein
MLSLVSNGPWSSGLLPLSSSSSSLSAAKRTLRLDWRCDFLRSSNTDWCLLRASLASRKGEWGWRR